MIDYSRYCTRGYGSIYSVPMPVRHKVGNRSSTMWHKCYDVSSECQTIVINCFNMRCAIRWKKKKKMKEKKEKKTKERKKKKKHSKRCEKIDTAPVKCVIRQTNKESEGLLEREQCARVRYCLPINPYTHVRRGWL